MTLYEALAFHLSKEMSQHLLPRYFLWMSGLLWKKFRESKAQLVLPIISYTSIDFKTRSCVCKPLSPWRLCDALKWGGGQLFLGLALKLCVWFYKTKQQYCGSHCVSLEKELPDFFIFYKTKQFFLKPWILLITAIGSVHPCFQINNNKPADLCEVLLVGLVSVSTELSRWKQEPTVCFVCSVSCEACVLKVIWTHDVCSVSEKHRWPRKGHKCYTNTTKPVCSTASI